MIALNYDCLSYCGFFMAVKWDVKGILEDNWCYISAETYLLNIICPTYLDYDY